ncbi:MAG: restriction endonuclease subunit S [Methylophilus sp.]|uniref:restriction endonuclease subunit S n=1 Tax=Methylophilus sp. TaxID=29541 RepID=UPI003F9F261D
MSEKIKLVPKLRFPEFRDVSEWKPQELNQLGKLVSGLTYSPEDVRESGLLVLRSSNVQNGQISLDDNVYVTPSIKGANLAKPNDILICVRNGSKALIGKNALIPDGMSLCTHGAFMTVFRSPIAKFVYQLFQTDSYQDQVDADLGATINSINGSKFLKYKFFVPKEPKEQQKIADCLSSLDDLITVQNQKVEALKKYKKGMMQQLFPAEGKTVPKLRFSEFEEDGEWAFLNGDKIFEPISNKKHNSDLPILAISQEHGAIPRELIDYKVIATEQSIESYKIVEVGDFIISLRSFQGGIEYSNYKGICSPAYIILRKKIEVFDLFFKYYFKTDLFIRDLNKNIEGIRDGKMVSFFQFSEKLLPLPDYAEQKRIANCLTSIDDAVTSQIKKLESLREHKKGLMQQLFPKAIDSQAIEQ